ncbi:dipeptidylpeptidase, partial [Coemansia aciculifera]
MLRVAAISLLCVLCSDLSASQELPASNSTRPLDIRLFHSLSRIGVPIVSPNATKILFTQSRYNQDDNTSNTFISFVDLSGGSVQQLTPAKGGEVYGNPLWFDDDETFGFMHKNKLYRQAVDDTNATAIYSPDIDISSVTYRPGHIIFMASVYPNATLAETKNLAATKKRDSGLIYDNIWVRHWDEWMTLRKPSLFSIKLEEGEDGGSERVVDKETDLLQNMPAFHDPLLRWSLDEFTVDRQGHNAAFLVRTAEDSQSTKTSVDIYLVPVDGSSEPRLLTKSIEGTSSAPAFSADGQWLAWLQIEELAYESGKRRIYIGNLGSGKMTAVAQDWDRSPQS